ncbi:fumarylacetoacetate hydrolase family protein [Roseomonas populi]|uniref:Fumarylacetoacetate hydrolase family protein n=1 Tax=Roseomonas populi TaxID=3121582 RepID=A0ABT1XA70_9PROT|nr:fumarylacetoacetate hydrolase family protein [Roseomonas pecuniae]MCR0984987.1 fumarylacetoacetate hydrolase family protein [Roseomonas pecuniae]
MKLVSFEADGGQGFGAVEGDVVADLTAAFEGRATGLRGLLAAGLLEEARTTAAGAPRRPLSGLRLLPVIPDPDKIICVGLNYRDHVAETGRTETANPALFGRYAGSQVGHGQPLVRPKVSERFDYEGELAVVIGTEGRHVAEADALKHVAGYSCYNEGSVRDWQLHTTQFLAGKTFAGTGGFGPWLVTTDEIPDPSKLMLETRLNGEVVQHTTTDLLITSVPRLIAYISTILPLLPGDVIVSGTPGGVGAKRNPPLWMQPGDVAEVEISGIGTLRNPVVQEE